MQHLLEGLVLTKHGRRGWPHKRVLWLDPTHMVLGWEPVQAGKNTKTLQESRFIPLAQTLCAC